MKVMANNSKPPPETDLNKGSSYVFYTYHWGETQSRPIESQSLLFPSYKRKTKQNNSYMNTSSDFSLSFSGIYKHVFCTDNSVLAYFNRDAKLKPRDWFGE